LSILLKESSPTQLLEKTKNKMVKKIDDNSNGICFCGIIETQENDSESQALMNLQSNDNMILFVGDPACSDQMASSDTWMTNIKPVIKKTEVDNSQLITSVKSGVLIPFFDMNNKAYELLLQMFL
jgi:hypothetical protein